MQIADEIGVKNLEAYDDSKLIVNQVRREYEVRHETWYPIIMQLSIWQRGSKTSTSTMYLASKMSMQTHWHLLLLPWLFQPERQKVLVYNHDLYCPRSAFEDNQKPTGDLQVKEALETLTVPELRDWLHRLRTVRHST